MDIDYKFWITTVLTVIGLWIMYKGLPGMNAGVPSTAPRLKRYWPLAAMILLLLLNWVPFLISQAQRKQGPQSAAAKVTPEEQWKELERGWKADFRPKMVTGKTYANEVVPLDGHHYMNCKFINVTLKYNGTDNYGLTRNTFAGDISVDSDNPAILNIVSLVLEQLIMTQRAGRELRMLRLPPRS